MKTIKEFLSEKTEVHEWTPISDIKWKRLTQKWVRLEKGSSLNITKELSVTKSKAILDGTPHILKLSGKEVAQFIIDPKDVYKYIITIKGQSKSIRTSWLDIEEVVETVMKGIK